MSRTVPLDLLDRVRVASPCSASWEQMRPVGEGERVRHCDQCGLNVHNLSGMSRAEATALVADHAESGQRLCIQMFVRSDGRVLTRDCPVGLRAARLRLTRAITRVAAAFAFLATGGFLARSRERVVQMPGHSRVQPFATICEWMRPAKVLPGPGPAGGFGGTGVVRGQVLMGSMIAPPTGCN